MEAAFSLLPFDTRDPFHPHHSQSGLQDGLLFDGSPATRPKLPSALPALGGYATPAYLSHSRSSSYGQTPTATTYQAPLPFQPHNIDHQREWGVPQRLHASAASSPPKKDDASNLIPVAPADYDPTHGHHHQDQQPQAHRLCHTPSGEGDKQYVSAPPSTTDGLALATDNNKKLDFRAALTANAIASARPHLTAHNRSQSVGVGCGVNRPAIAPSTTHCHARSASVVVVGSNTNNNHHAGGHAHTDANGNNKGNGSGAHKRSKSSVSSTPSHKSAAAAENQKMYAYDPHRGPRSTDWMLSPETLAARPHKDAKFAQMVVLGLAKGRTKAGWAQARRPGKRDRDAAKKKLAEELARRQAEEEGGVSVDDVVADIKNMAVTGAHAHAAATGAGAA